jgi:hypothetical protein
MPVVARMAGIEIVFYHNEHPPPHFHVKYAEHHAVIDIASLEIVEGFLPVAKRRIVRGWAETRRSQLLATFVKATSRERLEPIE